jgi:hypothetical protein
MAAVPIIPMIDDKKRTQKTTVLAKIAFVSSLFAVVLYWVLLILLWIMGDNMLIRFLGGFLMGILCYVSIGCGVAAIIRIVVDSRFRGLKMAISAILIMILLFVFARFVLAL